jgi:hypothetical protein
MQVDKFAGLTEPVEELAEILLHRAISGRAKRIVFVGRVRCAVRDAGRMRCGGLRRALDGVPARMHLSGRA